MTVEQAEIIQEIEKIRARIIAELGESGETARKLLDQAAFHVQTAGVPVTVKSQTIYIRLMEGEYRVPGPGPDGKVGDNEESCYYTCDEKDAYGTAAKMYPGCDSFKVRRVYT